jgi:hypothetical protein
VAADEGLDLGVARADADVASSRAPWPARAGWARIVAHRLEAATRASTSSRSARKFGSMRGGVAGIGARQRDAAAALRPQQADVARVAVARTRLPAVVDELADDEVELQVGSDRRPDRCARSRRPRRSSSSACRPAAAPLEDALQEVDRAAQRQAEEIGEVRRVEDGDDVDVVVQVAADAGQVVANSMPSERRCSPGRFPTASAAAATAARPPRAALRARAARTMATPSSAHLDAGRANAVERIRVAVGAGDDVQVGAREVGRQVRLGGAEALAVLVRHLVEADAFLALAVEVGVDRVTRLPRRLDEDRPEAMRAAQVHDVERTALAVECVAAALVVLGALKYGSTSCQPSPGCLRSPSRRSPRAGRARRSSR